MADSIFFGEAFEGQAFTFQGQVFGDSSIPINSASLSSITYDVWLIGVEAVVGLPSPTVPVIPERIHAGRTFDPTQVVSDTLQDDPRWNLDTAGFNFSPQFPADTIPPFAKAELPIRKVYHIPIELQPFVGEHIGVRLVITANHFLFGKPP